MIPENSANYRTYYLFFISIRFVWGHAIIYIHGLRAVFSSLDFVLDSYLTKCHDYD